MNNRKLRISFLILLMILITGCANRAGTVIVAPTREIENIADDVTEPVTGTYSGEITGVTEYTAGEKTNKLKDVSLMAEITDGMQMNGEKMYNPELHSIKDSLIISYSLETDAGTEVHLAVYDRETAGLLSDVTAESGSAYILEGGDCIACIKDTEDSFKITVYDSGLNILREREITGTYAGWFSENFERMYITSDRSLYLYNLTEKEPKPELIETENGFACSAVDAVYTGTDGADYIVAKGMCGDLKEYTGTIKADTGVFVYLQPASDNDYYNAMYINGTYITENMSEDMISRRIVYRPGDTPVVYSWPYESEKDTEATILDGGNVFFSHTDGNKVEAAVFDRKTRLCIASTSFTVGSAGGEGYVMLCSTPVYTEDNVLIMEYADMSGGVGFYKWEQDGTDGIWTGMSVYDYAVPDVKVAEVDNRYNPADFHPGNIPDELKPLREKADRLQEKYGVMIHISRECSNMLGNYAIVALDDYEQVNRALDELDTELGKYPEGFMEQFRKEGMAGIDIYITSTLIGYNSDALEYAGGFQWEMGSQSIIAVDCTNKGDLPVTIHHELSHAIEKYVAKKNLLDDARWEELNPTDGAYADFYTYSYRQFGFDGTVKYTYYGCDSLDDVYFVDDYSMTYPAEDRARLWENIMSDSSIIEWENTPNLVNKINYYASCIRAAFDSAEWEDVMWEKYITES